MEHRDGSRWWKKLIGKSPSVTEGEKKVMSGNEESWLGSQEQIDARRIIEIGNRTGDQEMIKIGQARMRFLLGRETIDDDDLFR